MFELIDCDSNLLYQHSDCVGFIAERQNNIPWIVGHLPASHPTLDIENSTLHSIFTFDCPFAEAFKSPIDF
jgi:hypothetical protein